VEDIFIHDIGDDTAVLVNTIWVSLLCKEVTFKLLIKYFLLPVVKFFHVYRDVPVVWRTRCMNDIV
jgi:hypothetical protein